MSSLPSLSSNMSNIDQGALDMSAKNASFLKFLKLLGDIIRRLWARFLEIQ